MDENIKMKFKQILDGQIRYTSPNLAINMLISRLQKKYINDPGCFEACVQEFDAFAEKYPGVIKSDYANILAL